MSTLSHVHQLFSTDTCHAYLRTLRWKDRPLQCPHCHSQAVSPWGTYHLPPRIQTLPLQSLRADFQRPDQDAVRPEPAVPPALDCGDLSVVPVVFVSSHRQGVRHSCPHRLSLVLVAA